MKLKKIILMVGLLTTACVTAPTPPPGTLDQETMRGILTEIHMAEAEAQQVGFRTSDSTQWYYKYLEKRIFKKYRTDSTHYHDSYKFYSRNIPLMNEIYTAIVDTLEARQEKIKSQPDTSLASKNRVTAAVKRDSTIHKKLRKKKVF